MQKIINETLYTYQMYISNLENLVHIIHLQYILIQTRAFHELRSHTWLTAAVSESALKGDFSYLSYMPIA